MKKSLVAVSVIIALGAVWSGASWYTGKQLAQNIDEVTDNINTQLKMAYPNAGLKLVYRDYQGGVFSSKFAYVMQADGSAKGQQILAPGEEIVFNETFSHGPFPLAQLKKFNLVPTIASVHGELANTPPVKPLFDLTQNKPFIITEAHVPYSGDIHFNVTLLPIEHQDSDRKMSFNGADLQWVTPRDLRSNKLSITMNNLLMEKKNPWGEREKVEVKDVVLNSNHHKGKFDINLGDGNLTIKSLTFTVEGEEPVTVSNFSLQSALTEDDKNLAGNVTLALSLAISDRNLGSGNMAIAFSQIDAEGTKRFVTNYQKKVQQILQDPQNMNPDSYQQELAMVFLQYLPDLLKGNPNITLSPLSWKNNKGESTFTLAVDLSDPLQNSAKAADPSASDEEKIILQSVKKLDAKLNVPLVMLAELMVQAGQPPANDAERAQADKMALQQVQMMAGIGQMNQITVTKDNAITSSLQYADGQVDFNGNKMPLADFIAPFITIPDESNEELLPNGQEPAAPPAQ
ncbi:GTP-binding protein [Brenneria alni]|uniref:GTP-binding protein n=1 Tax=Brenneria alni TaxID=71656 RepID=A0A421DRV5_9GAMM|nr:YdgA family protein [Brenneria alni]RLM26917.1 GTP-binding protein [Brenneria alni]